MHRRFFILLMASLSPIPVLAQVGHGLLQQSLRAHLGRGPMPSDVVLTGQIEDGRALKPFRMVVKEDRVRYDVGDNITVFGPGGGWTHLSNILQVLPAHAASRRPDILPFLDLLGAADNSLIDVSALQTVTLGGQPVQRLTVSLGDRQKERREFRRSLDDETTFYIDPNNLLVVRSESTIPAANNMDNRFLNTLEFSDYRSVQGYAVPFRIVRTIGTGPAPLSRTAIALSSIAFNQGVPDATFMAPASGGRQ